MTRIFKDKTKVIILLLALTVLCLGLIGLTAYSTSLQYEINTLNSQIQDSEWTKRNVEVAIKGANTLSVLEAKAKELGLVSPTFDDIIYLQSGDTEVHDLASTLREIAYR